MRRYLVLMWQPSDPVAQRFARLAARRMQDLSPNWRSALESSGFAAFYFENVRTSGRVYVDAGRRGLVFGTLFPICDAEPVSPLEALPPSIDSKNVLASAGTALTDNCWGDYVAFFSDAAADKQLAYRSISGAISCFTFKHQRVRFFFSHFSDVHAAALLPPLTINWRYLSTYLFLNEPRIRDTGVSEVHELLAGDCMQVTRDSSTFSFPWDPRNICREKPLEDRAASRDLLRQTAERCIGSLASAHRHVLHQLSGGFDSAVVLGCIAKSDKAVHVTCLNRYSNSPGEDERDYARRSARMFGVSLIEEDWRAGGVSFDDRLFQTPAAARPSMHRLIESELQFRNGLATDLGADVIWNGEGGDHLFMECTGVPFAADYASRHGLKIGLIGVVGDNSRNAEIPIWRVLRQVIQLGFSRKSWDRPNLDRGIATFVNPAVATPDSRKYASHPWDSEMEDLPKGSQLRVLDYLEVLNRQALPSALPIPEAHPLLSQPLLEVCLRIPTYVHLCGGRPRGLAHDAFKEHIPAEIWARRSKGGTTSLVGRMFAEGNTFLRKMLLDGMLTEERIIDKEQLSLILAPGRPLRPEHMLPLLACLTAEVWLRQTEDIIANSAAEAVSWA